MSKGVFLFVVLLTASSGPATAQTFQFSLSVSDGASSLNLTLGTDPSGTDGFDVGLDQRAPPLPPSGAFDARYRIGPEDLLKDIRLNDLSQKTYTMLYQKAAGEGPIVLTWDTNDLPALFTFEIVDAITCILFGPLDMATTNTLDVSTGGGLLDAGLSILVKSTTPPVATRHVATTGSDACNDCTDASEPCATIAYAVAQANAGDTLDLAAGTYNEPGLVIEKTLLIQGQGVVMQ